MTLFDAIIAPGFFTNAPVQTALIVGGGAAVVSAAIGVFTVIRGQSFAGHALSDVSSAGGSLAFLGGFAPLWGFLGIAVLATMALEAVGLRRARERDLATGVVFGAGLGLTALLLHFAIASRSSSGAAISVMFGSIFAIPSELILPSLAVAAGALVLLGAIWRPLLLASVHPDLAAARGVHVELVGFLHLLVLALAVTLSAMTIGAILSTALLIGPAAAAVRLTRSPGQAVLLAAVLGLLACWGGILLAYDSYGWTPGHPWPVSFFIVSLIFAIYLVSGLRRPARPREA
jgi:zinc/manganese transport system permease protein